MRKLVFILILTALTVTACSSPEDSSESKSEENSNKLPNAVVNNAGSNKPAASNANSQPVNENPRNQAVNSPSSNISANQSTLSANREELQKSSINANNGQGLIMSGNNVPRPSANSTGRKIIISNNDPSFKDYPSAPSSNNPRRRRIPGQSSPQAQQNSNLNQD